ncbi:MAG: hypothetical protein ACREJN_19245, partial [Nitrospiraceae bacterium]
QRSRFSEEQIVYATERRKPAHPLATSAGSRRVWRHVLHLEKKYAQQVEDENARGGSTIIIAAHIARSRT